MKRMSKLTGDGVGRLKLYPQPNFEGEAKVFTDSDAIPLKQWKGGKVASVVVSGNPWLLFPEPQFKGVSTFLEEGRYPDLSTFPNLSGSSSANPGSVRFMAEDLGSPEITLYSSSSFAGETDFTMLDPQDQMKCISVGEAGIWAIRAKDETIWVRVHERNGKSTGKVDWEEEGVGEGWTRVQGAARQLSVGSASVWAVKSDNTIIVRLGISAESPMGSSWAAVDGDKMRQVSVSRLGHVWAVDANDKIWMRKGAANSTVLGTGWKMLPGALKQISVGECGVWGVSPEQQVWFRINTYGDPDNEGTGWQRIEGRFQQVYSGPNGVIALAGNRDLYHRVNVKEYVVGEKAMGPNNEGTHWVRLEQKKDKKIIFKQVETSGDHLWALDKDNHIFYKPNIYDDINSHFSATLFGDAEDFDLHNFPEKATTCKVASGGWALYSEPNYQGRILYQLGAESVSNDPPSKENGYKSWMASVGSARPIRGQNYRTPILRMTMGWDSMRVDSAQETLFCEEVKNSTEDYQDAPWVPTFECETTASHRFELSQAQNIPGCKGGSGVSVVRGCEFVLEPIQPIKLENEDGPVLYTSNEFTSSIVQPFTFRDETMASRRSKRTTVIKLPPWIPPRCTFKVKVVSYKAKVVVPFKADFKIGFTADFDTSSESWFESGTYYGEDDSNIKLELSCVKMPAPRKVSKMINGLGEDM